MGGTQQEEKVRCGKVPRYVVVLYLERGERMIVRGRGKCGERGLPRPTVACEPGLTRRLISALLLLVSSTYTPFSFAELCIFPDQIDNMAALRVSQLLLRSSRTLSQVQRPLVQTPVWRMLSTKHPKGFQLPTEDDLAELRERVQEFTSKSCSTGKAPFDGFSHIHLNTIFHVLDILMLASSRT